MEERGGDVGGDLAAGTEEPGGRRPSDSSSVRSLPLGIKGLETLRSNIPFCQVAEGRAKTGYQVLIFILTYWIYAVYTLTRRPFSVVKIALCPSCAEEGDNSSNMSALYDPEGQQIVGWPPFNSTNGKTLLGSIDYSLIFAYAVGLYISGYIADRVNLRYFIAIGLSGCALAASSLGIGYFARVHHLAYFIVFQIFSGFMQSTGWPGLLGITAKWFGKKNRGLIMGLWSSCSFVGSILSYIVPSFFIYSAAPEDSPWGWSFITPALIALTTALMAFLFLVTDPQHLGFSPAKQTVVSAVDKLFFENDESRKEDKVSNGKVSVECQTKTMDSGFADEPEDEADSDEHQEHKENPSDQVEIVKTRAVGCFRAFLIPGVVEYSIVLFFAKFVTYSFNYWLPFYISVSYRGFGGQRSAWLSTLFDIGAIIGALGIGVFSDRLPSSRAVVLVPMLLLGIPTLYVFRVFGDVSLGLYSFLIFLLGFFINGPHIIIGGAVANDLGTHKSLKESQNAKSVVSGIIDGTGTLGAATGPLVVGIVTDRLSWDILFYILMCACFLSAMFLSRLLVKDMRRLAGNCKRTPIFEDAVSSMDNEVELIGAREEKFVELKGLETAV